MQEALYYQNENGKIRCQLCPHLCLIGEEKRGNCGVRLARGGRLFTENYGLVAAAHWDPIEKKPLYHFHPGRPILSIGTFGCNFCCSFCQNWNLARGSADPGALRLKPDDILAMLEKEGGPQKALGVAYTYNEPLIWYEFVLDTVRLLNEQGYKNVLVTNGFINRQPLAKLLPYIDALNIDVKGYSDHFYRQYCRGQRQAVLNTVEEAVKYCHVEITCLLIPTLNDQAAEQEELARWLAGLDKNLVLHYSRYLPSYKLDLPPTGEAVLKRNYELARQYLNYVYLGNIELPGYSDTHCPHCGNLLIARSGYRVRITGLRRDSCSNCGSLISLVVPED